MQDLMNKIHNVDCLEFMKLIPDQYFDLVLTDPPYGINIDTKMYQSNGKKYKNALAHKNVYLNTNWDSAIPTREYFDEMRRISKYQIIFGGNYFIEYLSNSPCWLVWDKQNGNNNFADCEIAWTNFNTAVRKYEFLWNGMLQQDMRHKEHRYHPTQKPITLFKSILLDYSKTNYKIFDPFMGAGTTAIACAQLGLQWCGCELQAEYVDIAKNRLQYIQTDMFGLDAS